MKKKKPFLPTMITIGITIALLGFIVLSNNNAHADDLQFISISSAQLLTESDYRVFVGGAVDKSVKLNLNQISEKLLTHPYISSIESRKLNDSCVEITLCEKKIVGRFLAGENNLLISSKGELISILPNTKDPDVPIVSTSLASYNDAMTPFVMRQIRSGLSFIKAALYDTLTLSRNISEVFVSNNGTMIVTLFGLKPSFIINENGLARQTAYLIQLLKSRSACAQLLDRAEYIDLRMKNKIYIGNEPVKGI